MQREKIRLWIVVSAVSGVLCGMAGAQPSSWVCGTTGGGKTICVRFDNRPDAPVLDEDFSRILSDPPEVTLKQGADGSGVLHWRIKCYDSNGPADIGSIAVDGSENFELLIADENGDPGAANLSSAVLTPDGGYSSILSGSHIAGDLTGNLTTQGDANANGGDLNLDVGGDVAAASTITAKHISFLRIGHVGSTEIGTLAGTLISKDGIAGFDQILMGTLTGSISFVDDFGEYGAISGVLKIWEGGSGTITAGNVDSSPSYIILGVSGTNADFSVVSQFGA